MKKIILILILSSTVLLNAKTWVREYTYNASEADSKLTSRAISLEQVKRLLLQEIRDIAPKSHRLYVNFGSIYIELKQFDKALIAFRRAIELNPKEGYYHYMVSLIYKEKGNYKKSIEYKNKAQKLGFVR